MVDVREAANLLNTVMPNLDSWQRDELVLVALEQNASGRWRYGQVVGIVPRQNGKGDVLIARELVGLFLDPDCKLIVHSAHEFSTSLEAFRRLLDIVEDFPLLATRLRKPGGVKRSHGEEGLELIDGSRIRFKTRTKAGGRGLSSDLLIMDEAMILPEAVMGALYMTMSARPNPQVYFTGSAADVAVHEHGHTLARLRRAGLDGSNGLLYVEHTAAVRVLELAGQPPDANPLDVLLADPELLQNEKLWRLANPAMAAGRIRSEHVAMELATLDPRTFAVERLGVTEWPSAAGGSESIISAQAWRELMDPKSEIEGPVVFAVDVSPNRSRSTIASAGYRPDGLLHVEIVEHTAGTRGLPQRLKALVDKHGGSVALDGRGPASSLQSELEADDIEVVVADSQDMAHACGRFFDAVEQRRIRHLGTAELAGAVAGAATRPLGDAWAWARLRASIDISPLVAVTLAAWALDDAQPELYPFFMVA